MTLEEKANRFPLYTIGEIAMIVEDFNRRVLLADQITHSVLHERFSAIQETARERFGHADKKKLAQFIEYITHKFETPFEKIHSSMVLREMQARLGEGFMQRLEARVGELEDISADMLNHVYQDGEFAYQPHTAAEHIIEFDGNTLPEIIGMNQISFMTREDGGTEFAIDLESSYNTSIIGSIEPTEGQPNVVLSINFEGEHARFQSLISHIVIANYCDLVKRERMQASARSMQNTSEQSNSITNGTNLEPQGRTRTIPRRTSMREVQREIIERSNMPVPRLVDSYTRGVPYSIAYRQAIEQYNARFAGASEIEQEQLSRAVEAARAQLILPSRAKLQNIQNLPTRFQQEMAPIRDPVSGELVHTKTWVIEHISPRPTDDTLSSPTRLYREFYQSRNPTQTQFLDYISSWIIEDASTENNL